MPTQMMEAFVSVKLDTKELAPSMNRLRTEFASQMESAGKAGSAKLFDVDAFKNRMSVVFDTVAKLKREMDFEFKIGKITDINAAKSAFESLSHELNTIKAQMTEVQRAKIALLTGMGFDAKTSIAYGTGAGMPSLMGRTAGGPQEQAAAAALDLKLKQLGVTARDTANQVSAASRQIAAITKQSNAEEQAALNKTMDLMKQRASVQAAVNANQAVASAQTQTAMRLMVAAESRAARMASYGYNQGPGAAGGRGGPGGVGNQMGSQLAFGISDFATVLSGGGSFGAAMIGASNNLQMLFMNVDKVTGGLKGMFKELRANQGALAGLAVSVLAVTLPRVIEQLGQLWSNTTAAALKYRDAINVIQQQHQAFERGRGFAVHGEGLKAGLELQAAQIAQGKAGRPDEREAAKHGFMGMDKDLRNRFDQTFVNEKTLQERIRQNEVRRGELDKEIGLDEKLRRQKEMHIGYMTDKATFGEAAAEAFHEKRFPRNRFSEAQFEEKKRQRDAIDEDTRSAQDEFRQQSRDRAIIKNQIETNRTQASKELGENTTERLDKFENELTSKIDTGNEFRNRRNRIAAQQVEYQERINKETVDMPNWRRILSEAAIQRTGAAFRDVDQDQRRDKEKFMTDLKHQAHGTGRVGAIEADFQARRDEIEKRRRGGELTDADALQAHELNRQKSYADTQQLIHSTKAKSPAEYVGIEEFAKKLQLAVLGDDDKKIQETIEKNTHDAAIKLGQILEKVGPAVAQGP